MCCTLKMKFAAVSMAAFLAISNANCTLAAPGDVAAATAETHTGPWTLDQAIAHMKLYPHDAYVEYVALQLARREGKVAQVAQQIAAARGFDNFVQQRRDSVDLFSIFSGALAVQESLQLDAMIADQPGIGAPGELPPGARRGFPQAPIGQGRQGPQPIDGADVSLRELTGPTIKSHPWEQMLAGRKPQISQLARSVPEDFYFAEFRSINKLTEATKIADLWSTHLFNQSIQEAQTQLAEQRLNEQLAVEVNPLLAPFYDSVVSRIAITGSDLFLREGSDVTLLFELKQPDVFRVQADEFLNKAATKPGAKRTSGTYKGVEFDAVETPDRRVHVFSAYPKPDLHVRTNSRLALNRIIDAINGHNPNGRPVRRLGDSLEFAYIRTLMPPGAPEEDGLIYLSDPFMRHMVGPGLRLTERHRMVCYNDLKMISHAALMYRTEHGKTATSLAELAAAGCTPGEFGAGKLACPDGGTYTLGDDGLTGVCSHHGYSHSLTPCCEIEVQNITAEEAKAYQDFLEQYNQYWRLYFDPIAVRLTVTPKRYRAETIVLPLIDNTVYTGLATALGGKPEQLDALPVPKRNIFSVAVRVDKRALLKQMQMDQLIEETEPAATEQQHVAHDRAHSVQSLKELALAHLNYESVRKRLAAAAKTDRDGRPLLSWRVELLPYLEQQDLYQQFHRDEPWDSAHNKQLISRMPDVFRPSDAKLAAAGKTKFVAPRGKDTLFPLDNKPVAMKNITDGTSQTILIAEATDDRAVIWTKPDDLEYDPQQPNQGLESRSGDGYLIACCDGSVHKLDPKIGNASLASAFTRAGGEIPNWHEFDRPLPNERIHRSPFFYGMPTETLQQLRLGQLVSKGIGNQISFNVYDAQQLFDLSLPKAMGMMFGSFGGRGARGFDDDFIVPAFLIGSLNSPVYVAVPVKDRKVVDEFLTRLDGFLTSLPHERGRGWIDLEQDFYHIEAGETPIRTCAISIGPVKWRFFWQRIGDALYVASQRNILDDIAAITSKDAPATTTKDEPAHALVRLRPEHWNQVLDHYQLGWEESNRQACLKNIGPLLSLNRALMAGNGAASPKSSPLNTLNEYTARLYDVHYFCPDDGHYTIGADGAVTCSKHGSATAPHQSVAPAATSELGKLLGEFSDMSLSLTFLEDGLHAVVNLERKE